MKYFSIKFAWAAAVAVTMVACSSDDEQSQTTFDENEIRIEAVHPSALTRVNDTGFDNGDKIGVYVVAKGESLQPGGNVVNNGTFTYNGSTWTPARKYYWNEGLNNVYAYYPYQASIDDTEDYRFVIPEDQSTAEGYAAADFLWASATDQTAGNSAVKLKFSHCMSRLMVKLEKSENYEGDLPKDMQVYVHSLSKAATIDLSAGGASADGQSGTQSVKARKLTDTTFCAIVAPQRISSRRPLIEVVTGNVSYLVEGTISLKQGFQHTVTVTLSKSPEQTEIEIGGGIGGWN